jgi:serine/threonine-protein kinase RsbW
VTALPRGREPETLRAELTATVQAVRDALVNLTARLASRMPRAECEVLELALGEVLTNIARHAYDPCAPGPVTVSIWLDEGGAHCTVTDLGRPFPVGLLSGETWRRLPERTEDLPEGGFGWPLIRSLARDLRYRRDMGVNQLSFRVAAGAH